MHIDPEKGVLTLDQVSMVGGMTPADFGPIPGFRPNSSLDSVSWWWAPELDGLAWTPFFNSNRLISVHLNLRRYQTGKAAKEALDNLIIGVLGEPMEIKDHHPSREGDDSQNSRILMWKFVWGRVTSALEPREWTPQVWIEWKAEPRLAPS